MLHWCNIHMNSAWLCLGLCVYVADCELTCYGFQRGVSSAGLIPQDVEHTFLVNTTEESWDHQRGFKAKE